MAERGQSIEVHRRACVFNAGRNRRSARLSTAAHSRGKTISDATSSNETAPSLISHFKVEPILESDIIQGAIAEVVSASSPVELSKSMAESLMASYKDNTNSRLSAKDIKEREIQKAMRLADSNIRAVNKQSWQKRSAKFGLSKVFLALACATLAVLGIVYLVDTNSPDISRKVAAMQTGIDAVYPKYTPRGFTLSDITSENGRVTLNFKNIDTNGAYSLIEDNIETLSGDEFRATSGNDLLIEYVKENFSTNYNRIDEHGLSIYIGNNGAAWVDGKVMFKLKITSGTLTRKQIVTIATTK